VERVVELLNHWLNHYGAFGLFFMMALGIVGLPIPEETTLTLAGVLIYRGHLQTGPALVAALAGAAVGVTVSYTLGRTLGLRLLLKHGAFFHVSAESVEKAHVWFERVGHWSLFVGYFFPGIRHLTAIAAGASKLKLADFALFAYTGALVWSYCFIAIGVFLGRHSLALSENIHRNMIVGSLVLVAIIALSLLARRWLRTRTAAR
jgi:membrane protein DedA with SNARE-associated domain